LILKKVWDFGANTQPGAGVGYQNCPDFCANQDKALCTGCFNIPSNLAQGKYVFLWEWAFNTATDKYTTCWDVTIVASTGNTVTELALIGPDDFAVAKAASLTLSSGAAATAGTAGGAGATAGTGTGTGPNGINPCSLGVVGVIGCQCAEGGVCNSGLTCSSQGVCVSPGSGSGSKGGSIAAGVILALLVVTAVVIGVILYARYNPYSDVGKIVNNAMNKISGKTSPSLQSRRDPLLSNDYAGDNL